MRSIELIRLVGNGSSDVEIDPPTGMYGLAAYLTLGHQQMLD
jgi:hypothetical protein